jgi:RNA polymerase sigma-70 factor (ECF subfamily)
VDRDRRAQFERAALPLSGALYRAALALARNDADAQDLVQETYFRAYRSYHTYASDDNFKAWMMTILRNVWLDACRRRRQEASMPADAEPAAPDAGPAVDLNAALPDDLKRAFDALSPAHQLLVLMVDLQSMTYREAAAVLNCPIGSVMSGLHNARRKMREFLSRR